MSHEHRQHPERFYDDEGEAYSNEPPTWDQYVDGDALEQYRPVFPLSSILGAVDATPDPTVRTWTFSPQAPRTMTRRQTYRHCMDGGLSRWDSLLWALMTADERPKQYGHRPMFTVERTDQ